MYEAGGGGGVGGEGEARELQPLPIISKCKILGKKQIIFGKNHLILGQALVKKFDQETSACGPSTPVTIISNILFTTVPSDGGGGGVYSMRWWDSTALTQYVVKTYFVCCFRFLFCACQPRRSYSDWKRVFISFFLGGGGGGAFCNLLSKKLYTGLYQNCI